METHRLLRELEQAAGKLGIKIRTEQLRARQASPGGLCVLRGQRVVLLNSRVGENERLMTLADILAPLVTDEMDLSDEARILLKLEPSEERVRQSPTRPAGPGVRRAAPRG